ncbi:MAG: hypothetical protein FJ260_02985 [Planctomycetes bacterium]|nr:hypothetical protein [Planctomycetota bacterium]
MRKCRSASWRSATSNSCAAAPPAPAAPAATAAPAPPAAPDTPAASSTASPFARATARRNSPRSREPTTRINACGSTLAFSSSLCMAPQCGPAAAGSDDSRRASAASISFTSCGGSGGSG